MLERALGFSACAVATLDALIAAGRVHQMAKGEALVRRGDPFDHLGILVAGSLESRVLVESGVRHLLHFLQPGDVFGITTCCDGGPHVVDLIARGGDVVTLMVPGAVVRTLSAGDPGLPQALARQLAFRGRELYERLVADSSMELTARLARLIVGFTRHYGIDRPAGRELSFKASQADFADMLGATRQSVNAAFHRFREEGLIATRYSTITVIDFDRLCECADIPKDPGQSSTMLWPPLASSVRN
jgi:CRP/FNR family transcriptional regulator, cyclic AMP receptor protein